MSPARIRDEARGCVAWWQKVLLTDGCWHWLGHLNNKGYGTFGRLGYAHRYSYETFVGPIDDGFVIHHTCRNPGCVNPSHPQPVTNGENIHLGYVRRRREGETWDKSCCPKGHAYTPENDYRVSNPNRVALTRCKICRREASKKSRKSCP